MDKYSKPRVFLYLDPSHLFSGKKYRHNFTAQDLKDLKGKMDLHPGSYLLNLSTFDSGMEEIFGSLNKVIEYANPSLNTGGEGADVGNGGNSDLLVPFSLYLGLRYQGITLTKKSKPSREEANSFNFNVSP